MVIIFLLIINLVKVGVITHGWQLTPAPKSKAQEIA